MKVKGYSIKFLTGLEVDYSVVTSPTELLKQQTLDIKEITGLKLFASHRFVR